MHYNVHALDAQQQVIALSLEAGSEADARGMAESRGLTVFSIEGKRTLALPRLHRAGGGCKTSLFSVELLSRYIAYHDELDKVKKKVVSASIYPAILMIVGTLVLGFLMFYVVPRFASVYDDMRHTLPFFSQLLLSFGSFIGRHGYLLFSAFILGAGSAAWALSRPNVR